MADDDRDNKDREHIEWLVPSRSAVQHEMLRLYRMLDEHAAEVKERTPEWRMLAWLLGATFSLWRAVFQAGSSLQVPENAESAKAFLKKAIEDNIIGYQDEKRSWPLGYYLNNARFRLLRVYGDLPEQERSHELIEVFSAVNKEHPPEAYDAHEEWRSLFRGLEGLTDVLEKRVRQKGVGRSQAV